MPTNRVRHCRRCGTNRVNDCCPTCSASDPGNSDNWRDQPTKPEPCPAINGQAPKKCPWASDPRGLCQWVKPAND